MLDRRALPLGSTLERRARLGAAGAAAAAVAGSVLVAADGSAGWRVLRAAAVLAAGVLVVRLVRAGGRGGVAAGVVAGAVAACAGAGIAVPHLAKGGGLALTAAGSVAAVAGVVLFVTAAVAGVGRCRRWRKVAAVLGAAVVAALGAELVTIPVMVTNVPRTALGRTPADVGLDRLDAVVPTADGVELAAWYVPSRGGAAVVLLHGAGSTRSATVDHAAVLAGAGYGVLLLDARGHGRSGGQAMDLGWNGDADVAAGVDWLAKRPDVDPSRIGAVGLSMGGEEAIGAAGADVRLAAVVAEGATARVSADHGWLSERYGARGAVQEVIEAVQERVTDALTDASPPSSLRRAVAAAAPRPVLLVAAGDVDEEAAAAEWIRAGAPASVEVWVVPGSGHTGGLDTDPHGWARRVLGFLDRALG